MQERPAAHHQIGLQPLQAPITENGRANDGAGLEGTTETSIMGRLGQAAATVMGCVKTSPTIPSLIALVVLALLMVGLSASTMPQGVPLVAPQAGSSLFQSMCDATEMNATIGMLDVTNPTMGQIPMDPMTRRDRANSAALVVWTGQRDDGEAGSDTEPYCLRKTAPHLKPLNSCELPVCLRIIAALNHRRLTPFILPHSSARLARVGTTTSHKSKQAQEKEKVQEVRKEGLQDPRRMQNA